MTAEGSPAQSYQQRTKGPMGNSFSVNIRSTRKLSPVKYSIFQTHAGSTLKMRFPLVLLSLFALNGVKSFPLNSSNSRTRQCQKPPVNNCNCQCTVNQNTVHLTDAMRSMEAKLDNLITLVNNISSNPQPAKKPGNQKSRF